MDAFELDAKAFLEGSGQSLEVVVVHGEGIWVALVADYLVATSGQLAVHSTGPPALDGWAYEDHGPVVGWVPIFHSFQGGNYLVVVVAIFQRKDVPAV